jgi:hypothetical protein
VLPLVPNRVSEAYLGWQIKVVDCSLLCSDLLWKSPTSREGKGATEARDSSRPVSSRRRLRERNAKSYYCHDNGGTCCAAQTLDRIAKSFSARRCLQGLFRNRANGRGVCVRSVLSAILEASRSRAQPYAMSPWAQVTARTWPEAYRLTAPLGLALTRSRDGHCGLSEHRVVQSPLDVSAGCVNHKPYPWKGTQYSKGRALYYCGREGSRELKGGEGARVLLLLHPLVDHFLTGLIASRPLPRQHCDALRHTQRKIKCRSL